MFRLDTAFVNPEGYYWLQKEHIDKVNNLSQTIDFLKLRLPTSMQECVPANIKKGEKDQSLRHAPNQQSSNALLLAPYRYLGSHAALRRKGHLHKSRDLASTKSLAVQLESVRAGRECHVRTIKGLERECLGELFCSICEEEKVSLCWLVEV